MTTETPSQEQSNPTIAIIGAGIVGVSCALHLVRLGKRVMLIDRAGPAEGTSHGNAGVLACCSVVPVTTPGILRRAPKMLFSSDGPLFMKWRYFPKLLKFLVPYLKASKAETVDHVARHLTPLVADSVDEHFNLSEGSPARKWLNRSPYMFVYADRAAYEADSFTWDLRKKNGFKWQVLEGDAIRKREPSVASHYGCAVILEDHGFVSNPGQYVKDLAATAVAEGVELRITGVNAIVQNPQGVTLKTEDGEIEAGAVVIATGAWSASLAKAHGANVPLESERGYHVVLAEPSMQPTMPVMDAKGKFVATPMADGLRVAGVVEFGGLDAPPSQAPFDLLLRGISNLIPNFTYKSKVTWMGHRPATADSLPVIGRSPVSKNVYFGYGHHHIGLTAGPKTGRLLAEMVAGLQPNIDLHAYRADRYS
ncbi:MAG: FAD-binding oxidoreductase [Rhodospirillales bacterium]|nr:FAD-binding oxidoreductase [Rhodospirillales bacterium]